MQKSLSTAQKFIEKKIKNSPEIAVVLGSGLGAFADFVNSRIEIPFENIPGFPVTGVSGHLGKLVFGELGRKKVVVMCGRPHYYEGHSMRDVVFPVRLFKLLGVKTLILSAAVGAVNKSYKVTDLVAVSDFINLMGDNPLRGSHDKSFGEMFPDMSAAFDKNINSLITKFSQKFRITTRTGVYLAVSGPSYETPAEINAFRLLGADVVGMSVVPETIAAVQMGMRVACVCNVSNLAAGVSKKALSHKEVLEAGKAVSDRFEKLLRGLIGAI
jgi:purine-nucleoside phosphorylase